MGEGGEVIIPEINVTNFDDSNIVAALENILTELQEQRVENKHDFLTTNFADYSVTEGLLLMLLLSVVTNWIVRMLKGGFWWLL